jgi:mannose-6-phosphate isomerase-like protein (cupin superfamily)
MTTVRSRDLVDGLDERRYLFVEHRLGVGGELSPAAGHAGYRTFLVIDGRVRMGGRDYWRLEGWHAAPGWAHAFRNDGDEPAAVLEAGALDNCAPPDSGGILDLSDYTVTKPWGEETWYTQNLPEPGYALKRIQMRAGHRSSLQSHRRKAETNYVIEGRATVLGGSPAPDDPDAPVDAGGLAVTRHDTGTGWTSAPNILHRVVAETDYTAIEVSTPELDDVIRWADESGRSHGRIPSEHGRAAS